MVPQFEQSRFRCQSITHSNGTDNGSGNIPDHCSRRTQSTKLVKKLDSQEFTPMDLDNPTDQLRRIWQDDLEFSRLRCSIPESIEYLENFMKKIC